MRKFLLLIAFFPCLAFAQAHVNLDNLANVTAIPAGTSLSFAASGSFAADTISTGVDDGLLIQAPISGPDSSGGGITVQAGNGVLIASGNNGGIALETTAANNEDIDLMSSGNIFLAPFVAGYSIQMYGDDLQVYTNYGLLLQPQGAQPTCDSTQRGRVFYVNSASGVADLLQVCMKDASDNYSWQTK